ncbi:hypothetical protein MMC24_004277 [Lignoscripta atroalba]|nr:hypothetical protein [Lignoscripta atroalba]
MIDDILNNLARNEGAKDSAVTELTEETDSSEGASNWYWSYDTVPSDNAGVPDGHPESESAATSVEYTGRPHWGG